MSNHDLTHEDLDPKIKTGVGNPLSPYQDTVLTLEEEKSIDDKGRKVVHGKLWSKSGTNRYLVVALHNREMAECLTDKLAKVDIDLTQNLVKTLGQRYWTLSIMTTEGKPRFLHGVTGACLEIPDDLAEDAIKRQYVVEWLVNTCDEAMIDRRIGIHKNSRKQAAAAVADAAQIALSKAL